MRRSRIGLFALLGLCASCRASTPLDPGAAAPALSAVAHDGSAVELGTGEGRPVLVYFYPKDGTPGCTKEACAFRDVWSKYEDAGVLVIGVSSDSAESHRAFAQKHALPFPLVSDEDGAWATAFGVGSTLGITNRDSFLIGPDGTIAKVYPGVDPGVHAAQVLRDASAL